MFNDQATHTWNVVAESSSFGSNVELLRYRAKNKGIYKWEVVKYFGNSESYEDAPDDILAISYVKE